MAKMPEKCKVDATGQKNASLDCRSPYTSLFVIMGSHLHNAVYHEVENSYDPREKTAVGFASLLKTWNSITFPATSRGMAA